MPESSRPLPADTVERIGSSTLTSIESGLSASLLTQVLPFFDHGVVGTLLALEQSIYAGVPAPA